MKKIKLGAFLFGLIYTASNAQNIMPPEPTTSSISNYVNAAASPATGVPNIGFPLYQLETINKDLPVNISLSYHVYNARPNVPASEVGQGWSLFTSGVISREVSGDPDEITNWTDINEQQADTFYYTIPGHSGKFKIYRDAVTGNALLNNLTGEKIKIDYERDLTSTKLIINSFKITDDRGFQYFFQEHNIGLTRKITYINYKTSFLLTKVTDPTGNEIAGYTYDKQIKYMGTSTTKKYQYCKINTISTVKGKLKFNYSYNALYDENETIENDPYTLNSISLTDPADRLQSKYQFMYLGTATLADEESQNNEIVGIIKQRKALSSVQKLDKNLAVAEETLFEYDQDGSSTQYGYYDDMRYGNFICSEKQPLSPKKYTMGLLKKITFPTKGYVVYDFEANTTYLDKSAPDYATNNPLDPAISYYEHIGTPFDTNIANNYPFAITGNNVYFVPGILELYDLTDPHGNIIPFKITIRNSSGQVQVPLSSCSSNTIYKPIPGNYTASITGGGNGSFAMYTLKTMPAPYKNESVTKAGARVKMIQSFDADGTLVKTKKYEYDSFTQLQSASGEVFFNDNYLNSNSPYDSFVLYKNVKETEISGTENNGYIKYYFKTPQDYFSIVNSYYSYYNLTVGGILDKKEVYNKQNQIVESSQYEYNFQEIPNVPEVSLFSGFTKPSWLQYVKEISKTYLNQSPYQTISETTFSANNFKESYLKATAQDGSVTETTTKYATDLGNTRFINKNIISTPLEVETKTDGTVMTKVTTKYDNTAHFYPTSIEKTDLNQVAETQMTFDLYDDKGNLVQMTDKAGNSVTTIWGYYKTLPIAQIMGVKYNDISSLSVVTAAVNASNADADNPANEAALLTALNNLRLSSQLQGYSMTVYSYDPLVGVTNSISSNGIKKSYEYDASGRLLKVKNSEGQLIKENQYNYKH